MIVDLNNLDTYEITQFSSHKGDICLISKANKDLSIWATGLSPYLFAALFSAFPKAFICFEMTIDNQFVRYNAPDLGLPTEPQITSIKTEIGDLGKDYIPSPEPGDYTRTIKDDGFRKF